MYGENIMINKIGSFKDFNDGTAIALIRPVITITKNNLETAK